MNLSLDQGQLSFIENYIPTRASAVVMNRYLRSVLNPGDERASILIGPYGKGKSHTLFVALAAVSEYGEGTDEAFLQLADRLDEVSPETAEMLRRIRRERIQMLPVIINDRYLDIQQAFLASLRTALEEVGLSKVMPDNYFERCLETIERWRKAYPDTYQAYRAFIEQNGLKVRDFERHIRQYDTDSLGLFRMCHETILSGAVFDPLLESDVPGLYQQVSDILMRQHGYSGMFIVFDEFGKYLESTGLGSNRFKLLQDLAEVCTRSVDPCMLLTCVSHKAIGEYASHLGTVQRSSFRTIEGRFVPIYFTSTFEGNFSLIAGALTRQQDRYASFIEEHRDEQRTTIDECTALGCFSGYESTVEQIVTQCFPMHPLTTLCLIRLSERAAQNERTLLTFLAGNDSPLTAFIAANKGTYALATVPMVYRYFHTSIRENSYDEELRRTIIYADSLIPTLESDEADLVRAVVLFSMVADNSLLATRKMLMAALQWDKDRLETALVHLEQMHRVYIRRSDGVVCLMHSATETVQEDIRREISLRRNRVDIADQLAEVREPGYTIPRRYNDHFEMVRYYRNVFVSAEVFKRQQSSDFLQEYGFSDGYVIYIIGEMGAQEVQERLKAWNDPRIVCLLPSVDFDAKDVIEECSAIRHLSENPADEVAAEELGYYLEDMLEVVNQSFETMFGSKALLITGNSIRPSFNLGGDISTLCERLLYPETPVICHEMINRSMLSGQMKQVREKVIDQVLNDERYLEAFPIKTAEGAVIRAVLGHVQNERMRKILSVIQTFVSECGARKQPLTKLYDQLMASPYGLRKGVIPILLAYVLREKLHTAMLYNREQELPLNGDSLSAMDDHVEAYTLMVDQRTGAQNTYLERLSAEFTPEEAVPSVRRIYDQICREIRALPRSARSNTMTMGGGKPAKIGQDALSVRSQFVQFGINPREVLLKRLPEKLGCDADGTCAERVIRALRALGRYHDDLMAELTSIVTCRFSGSNAQSVRGAMTVWLQIRSSAQLERVYASASTAILGIVKGQDTYSDTDLVNRVAVALTGLPVEDWSDKQIESFEALLEDALGAIEAPARSVEADESFSGSGIKVSLNGHTVAHALGDAALEGMSSVAYDSLKSAMDEFGDALTMDDKILILASLLIHIND